MRVEEQIVVEAPARRVWDVVTDPANYQDFMAGITRWETQQARSIAASAPAMRCAWRSARPRSGG